MWRKIGKNSKKLSVTPAKIDFLWLDSFYDFGINKLHRYEKTTLLRWLIVLACLISVIANGQ